MSKEDIEVINYKKDISEEYKINSLEVKSFEQKKLLKEPIKNIIYKNIIDDYLKHQSKSSIQKQIYHDLLC